MSTQINPSNMAPPIGPYSQGVLSTGPGHWLQIAGQLGIDPHGEIADTFEGQAHAAWQNVQKVLREAGMEIGHLVKVVTYITDEMDLPKLGPIRSQYLGDSRPASTLLVIKALARPQWKIEIEAMAFRAA